MIGYEVYIIDWLSGKADILEYSFPFGRDRVWLAGRVLDEQRARLSHRNAANCIFLHNNWPLYDLHHPNPNDHDDDDTDDDDVDDL